MSSASRPDVAPPPPATAHFVHVTEVSGDEISREQLNRLCNRYYWAADYCAGRDVVEVACGTGPGLGYLAQVARSLRAGDISEELLTIARRHYGDRVALERLDAQALPMADASVDTLILFEAIYYIPDADRFVGEARRVLRPGGHLLIATANKDLFDFNPSSYSHEYYGAADLRHLLDRHGFSVRLFGSHSVAAASPAQRVLRPVKKAAVSLNLIPKTMAGKKLLKRLVFGSLVPMPAEIDAQMAPREPPEPIAGDSPDRVHKVLYCVGTVPG